MAVDVARIVLLPHERSIHFTKRECTLAEPLKVGRSVDKKRILTNNLIFDCRVLSRNHALIWFENGKFFIKDTKSSNGTFVNEARLSSSGDESPPRELRTKDIVQFGVNVNVEKKAHGCIIARVRLFINDNELPGIEPPVQQVLQIIQSAVIREQELETKLVSMQTAIDGARQLATESMLAIVKEDELLSRLEMLENQLQVYAKNSSEDELKNQLAKAYEDKNKSELTSKNSMRNILQEKLEYVSKVNQLQRDYDRAEQECQRFRTLYDATKQEHTQDVAKLSDQLKQAEEDRKTLQEKLTKEKDSLASSVEALQVEAEFTKEQMRKTKQRLEDTVDELIKVKSTLEAEKQRKAAGISGPDVVESLSLGTDSLPPTDTTEQSVRNVDELEALPPLVLGDTGEGGAPVEGVSGDGESVGGAVDSPVTKDPTQRLTRRSTLLSFGDPLVVQQILERQKEREEKVKGLEEELEESEKTVRKLQVQLEEYMKQETTRKELTVQELARQITESAIAKGQIEIIQVSLVEAEEKIHKLEDDVAEKTTTRDKLQRMLEEVQAKLDESRRSLKDRETKLAHINDELGKKNRANDSLKGSKDSHVKESSSDVIEEVSRLKEKYTKQLRESVRVKTENTELVKEIEGLKLDLDRAQRKQNQASDGPLQKVGFPECPLPSPPRPLHQLVEDEDQRVKLLTIIALVSIGVALASWLT